MSCTLQIRPAKSLLPIPITERIRAKSKAKTDVVVTIRRRVPVAIGGTAVVTVVVPRAATKHTLSGITRFLRSRKNEIRKNIFTKPESVAVFEMRYPALQSLFDFFAVGGSFPKIADHFTQTPTGAAQIVVSNSN